MSGNGWIDYSRCVIGWMVNFTILMDMTYLYVLHSRTLLSLPRRVRYDLRRPQSSMAHIAEYVSLSQKRAFGAAVGVMRGGSYSLIAAHSLCGDRTRARAK